MKKYQIILLFVCWLIIDKFYVPNSILNIEKWIYVLEDSTNHRQSIREYDGTFVVGDKVKLVEKQQGLVRYKGLKKCQRNTK